MRLLDTSALLEGERDGKILLSVVRELDGLKNSEGLVGKKARDVIKYIYKEAMEDFYNEYKDSDFAGVKTDDILLEIAKFKNWTLVTADLSLFLKAGAMEVEREFVDGSKNEYKLQPTMTYIGDREYCEIMERRFTHDYPENHFLVFENWAFRIINGVPVSVQRREIKNDWVDTVKPRNIEQQCLIDLLHSEVPVVAVHSKYGCGKSYLMLNYILGNIGDGKKFNKLIVIPNNSGVAYTREVGTLPGDLFEKEASFLGPMIDLLGKEQIRSMVESDLIEIAPMAFVRGRNWDNCLVWVSESQNLTSYHVKLLLGRIGENTRIFFDGDVRQEDNKIFTENSGLVLLHKLSRTEGANLFGSVQLKTIERSKVAVLADMLDRLEE